MNQTQRDYLIKQVEKTYRAQVEKLKNRRPEPPSLNNYLIASVLDGSFSLQPEDVIKAHIKDLVLQLGPDKTFTDSKHYRYGRSDDDEDERMISLDAGSLFILSDSYKAAYEEFKIARAEWDAEMERVEGYKETIILKVQLGSPQVLAKLIEQVDNLADLNIINSSLLLTPASESKQIKA